jgi:5-formyltetrahydrofolate cyclo-ligase
MCPTRRLRHHRAVVTAKEDLRRQLRSDRARATSTRRSSVATGLLRTLRDSGLLDPGGRPGHVGPGILAAYLATAREPDLGPTRSAVREAGGTVLLPVPMPGRTLAWAADDGAHARHPTIAVDVPTGAVIGRDGAGLLALGTQLVLAPALAVDLAGTRLGQGGGYYDRLLDQLDGRLPVLAVVHDEEVLAAGAIPAEAHDRPVAGAVTPTRLIRFRWGAQHGLR